MTGHEGSWLAGEQGYQAGLMRPGQPLLGARFYEEVAPAVAMARAEIVALPVSIRVPAGSFERCYGQEDTSPLEPNATDHKVFCPGVGLVRDEAAELVYVGPQPPRGEPRTD